MPSEPFLDDEKISIEDLPPITVTQISRDRLAEKKAKQAHELALKREDQRLAEQRTRQTILKLFALVAVVSGLAAALGAPGALHVFTTTAGLVFGYLTGKADGTGTKTEGG